MNQIYKYFEPKLKSEFSFDTFLGVGICALFEKCVPYISNERISNLSRLNDGLNLNFLRLNIGSSFYGLVGIMIRNQEPGVSVIVKVLEKIVNDPSLLDEERLSFLKWLFLRVRNGLKNELMKINADQRLINCNGQLNEVVSVEDYCVFNKIILLGFSIDRITNESGINALEVITILHRSFISLVEHYVGVVSIKQNLNDD